MKSKVILTVLSMSLAACGVQSMAIDFEQPAVAATNSHDPIEEAIVLDFVNDWAYTSFVTLDKGCGLRADAAANIISHRDGPDGIPGTEDDRLFQSMASLEAVHRVGPVTVELLLVCAQERGRLYFERDEIVAFVNDQEYTTEALLTGECGLRSDAAHNIIAHRDGPDGIPGTQDDNLFSHIWDILDVYRVGPVALSQLHLCAREHGYSSHTEAGLQEDSFDETVTHEDLNYLPSAIADLVMGELLEQAQQLFSRDGTSSLVFVEVVVYYSQGKLVRYEVVYAHGAVSVIVTLSPELRIIGWTIQ